LIDRSTGFGKPGSSTGGVILDASGTASVSGSVPDPTGSPSSGAPGMYRGATTSGNRKVASPSSHGSGPAKTSLTTTRSPGRRFPTRMVNTPGRSSSAIAARRPSLTAVS
jgi:hypothetical protein